MEYTVHHNITPDNKSNKESIVDAMMANDLLTMEAYTFEINNTTFAAFDRWIAQLSPHFSALRSSWFKCIENNYMLVCIAHKFIFYLPVCHFGELFLKSSLLEPPTMHKHAL